MQLFINVDGCIYIYFYIEVHIQKKFQTFQQLRYLVSFILTGTPTAAEGPAWAPVDRSGPLGLFKGGREV